MIVDITYRTQERGTQRRLRVRFRQPDGTSAVVLYPGPDELMRVVEAANISKEVVGMVHEDAVTVANLEESAHYRHQIEIADAEFKKLGVIAWDKSREFSLSYENVGQDEYVLAAREWNNPIGEMSLIVRQSFTKSGLAERLARIALTPRDVRDNKMPLITTGRRISEDELETLFDPTKSEDHEEENDLGIVFDL